MGFVPGIGMRSLKGLRQGGLALLGLEPAASAMVSFTVAPLLTELDLLTPLVALPGELPKLLTLIVEYLG